MEAVAEHELSVILSSHLVSDLERTCDYLVVLVDSRVRLAGEMEDIVGSHVRLTGPRAVGHPGELVTARHTDVQSTLVVRYGGPIADPAWTVGQLAPGGHRAGLHGAPPRRARRAPWRRSDDLAHLAAVPVPGGRDPAPRWRAARARPLPVVPTASASVPRSAGATTMTKSKPNFASIAMLLLPAVIGDVLGCAARRAELETGTHRLIWNQSVTRTRWLLTKLLSMALSRWPRSRRARPAPLLAGDVIDARTSRARSQGIAGRRACTPRCSTPGDRAGRLRPFAFSLGVLAGTIIRRTVPAMALTAAVFTAVQLALPP